MAEPVRGHCFGYPRTQKLTFVIMLIWVVGLWMSISEHLARTKNSFTIQVRPQDLRKKVELDSLDSLVAIDGPVKTGPHKHMFFLNTHKAGGSIVRNIALRFVRGYNLTVLLPRRGAQFSFYSKNYWDNVDPQNINRNNDVICDYLVFNETFITTLMPSDTFYIGIVRDPFEQFLAAFEKYGRVLHQSDNYIRAIPGPYPVATYLENPQKWEPVDRRKSFTNNRMSFEFGLDVAQWTDKLAIQQYLEYLEERFQLVMVAEKFDESLILLRRLADWSHKDILYVRVSVFETLKMFTFNETQRQAHKNMNYADYTLYRRFDAVLCKKISEQVDYGFYSELTKFRETRQAVQVFCEKMAKESFSIKASMAEESFSIKASKWNDFFVVTRTDCKYMMGMLPLGNHSAPWLNYYYYKEEGQFLQ